MLRIAHHKGGEEMLQIADLRGSGKSIVFLSS